MHCSYTYVRGAKKGETCNTKIKCGELCSKHKVKSHDDGIIIDRGLAVADQTSLADIDIDALRIIISNVAAQTVRCNMKNKSAAVKSLIMLSMTCKTMHNLIDENVWNEAYDAYNAVDRRELSSNEALLLEKLSSKDRLVLFSHTGCQFCKAPRIRKVYPEFGVRCCKDCMQERTISSYRLSKDHLVNSDVYKGLPSITRDMYAHGVGSYTLTFYWLKDVEDRLGKTLQEHAIFATILRDNERRKLNDINLAEAISKAPFDLEYINITTKYMTKNTESPLDINVDVFVRQAWKIYNIKKLHEYILPLARSDGVLVAELKKTPLYNEIVSSTKQIPLESSIWCDILQQVRANRIHDAEKAMMHEALTRKIPWTFVEMCPSYLALSQNTLLSTSEWEAISTQYKTTIVLTPLRRAICVLDCATYICNECATNRQFTKIGIIQHTRDKHNGVNNFSGVRK